MADITKAYLAHLSNALMPALYEAGDVIMAIHKRRISSRLKADGSPVTEADEAAEAILLPALAKAAPDIPVISSAKGRKSPSAPRAICMALPEMAAQRPQPRHIPSSTILCKVSHAVMMPAICLWR